MLTQTIRTILERAAGDAVFREQLLTKPNEALSGYSLSPAEAAQIHSLSRENLEKFAHDLNALEGELTDEALQAVVGGLRRKNIYTGGAGDQDGPC